MPDTPVPVPMNKLTSFCILTTTCLGGVSFLAFNNGFLLAFLSRLEMSGSEILTLLALPLMVQFVLVMPFGYLSDWFGKKFIGLLGMVFSGLGLFLLTFAGVAPFQPTRVIIIVGIVAFGVGTAMSHSNWFALLDPLVTEATRGRFFGKLRLTWQGFGVGCFALVALMLERFPELETYRIVLGILALFGFVRMILFFQIPELEQPKPPSEPLWHSLKKVIKLPGYLPFCSYCFLLSLFTASSPQLFGLLEKEVLQLSDDQLVMLGNLMVAGALIGFVVGGNMVDRIGTKYVFLFCHFGYGIVLLSLLMRGGFPVPVIWVAGFVSTGFGFVQAASSIAMTSEILYLIPKENKSLATGFWLTLWSGGSGLSGVLFGQLLGIGILSSDWVLFGQTLSQYDGMLLLSGGMIVLLTVTLGLIPSVIRVAQWIPQGT